MKCQMDTNCDNIATHIAELQTGSVFVCNFHSYGIQDKFLKRLKLSKQERKQATLQEFERVSREMRK